MKLKLFSLVYFFCIYSFSQNTTTPIKLVGLSNNFVTKWTVGSLGADSQTAVSITGVLVGTSTFDATTGNYYAKVSSPASTGNINNQLKFNVQSNLATLSASATFSNSGSEVDMQTGMIYSYERIGNQYYMNRYNPTTNLSTNLGDFTFGIGVYFFPDSNCYDTNNKKYYFLIGDNSNVLKLVTVNVAANPIVITILPLTLPANLVGNIGLEFNNTTNEIIANYSISGGSGTAAAVTIGKINTTTNSLQTITTISGAQNYILGARTFDQNNQSLLFRSTYSPNSGNFNGLLVKYNMLTNTSEFINIPFVLNEFEADNYQFASAKYGLLNSQSVNIENISVFPNPTTDSINFSKDVTNIQITDMLGKTVYHDQRLFINTISLTNLGAGIYNLTYGFENQIFSKKIIKN